MRFVKYQALGNDYLVLDGMHAVDPDRNLIRAICDRHYGVGSDGVLILSAISDDAYTIRIINPDGSEAEKSGNGLRIFARYLWDEGFTSKKTFDVITLSDKVTCRLEDDGTVTVDMGRASFDSKDVPVNSEKMQTIREVIEVGGQILEYTAVSTGNPHCVIISENLSEERTRRIGKLIENHPIFPNRTNVQFVEVLDKNNIRIDIWERGAGYTYSSGSSSSAAACVVHKLGMCERDIDVHMAGGIIKVTISDDFHITISGDVRRIAEGSFSADFIDQNIRPVCNFSR
ncbi:MAG: diaminopimelate epimerase [Gammaproteobacteria bacterium]|nr:diaminopimelate epimerase [Gammaproteobacteria bacterium]